MPLFWIVQISFLEQNSIQYTEGKQKRGENNKLIFKNNILYGYNNKKSKIRVTKPLDKFM